MELLALKYFCDAAVSENFSQTAKKFGVPPSDISQSIKRIERELGVLLFIRRANSIELNDAGKKFYARVSMGLSIISDAEAEIRDDGRSGKIKICINSNRRVVMQVIERYRKAYPSVEIITTHFVDPMSDDFDLIIDCEDERLSEYNRELLISEEIMLAVRHDSPYASEDMIDIARLADEAFVSMSSKTSMYRITKEICADFGFEPKIVVQSDDPFYVRKCVEMGIGVCFAPSFSWQGQFPCEIVLKNVGNYKRSTYVYFSSQKYTPACVKHFFDMLLDIK